MLKRHLKQFGLDLVWEGKPEVKVLNGEVEMESIPLSGNGIVTACKAMKDVEEELHTIAAAMC